MLSLDEIIRYSKQPSPSIQALNPLVNAAQAIGQANRRNNADEAYQRLRLAFSDETSDPAEVDRLIAEAAELAPELTFKIQQMVSKGAGQQKRPEFQQVKTEGLEGYIFNPETGEYSISQDVKNALAEKAQSAANKGVKLDASGRRSINSDVTTLTKDAKMISNTAKDLEKLGSNLSGPASVAIVFKFMKALDPTSVVRESEFATAENSAGVPEGVRNIYNRLINGERLGDEQVKQFISTANDLSQAASESARNEVSLYLDTYEDTISPGFKENLLKRIPAQSNQETVKLSPAASKYLVK